MWKFVGACHPKNTNVEGQSSPKVARAVTCQGNAVYYMWDTLTVGLYLQPTLCSWETMPLQGHVFGKEQGRISRARNSSSGTKVVNVAKVTDVPAFVEFLLSLFNR